MVADAVSYRTQAEAAKMDQQADGLRENVCIAGIGPDDLDAISMRQLLTEPAPPS